MGLFLARERAKLRKFSQKVGGFLELEKDHAKKGQKKRFKSKRSLFFKI